MMAVWLWWRRWGWVPIGLFLTILGLGIGKIVYGRKGKRLQSPIRSLENAIARNNHMIDAEIAQAKLEHEEKIKHINESYKGAINGLDEAQRRRKANYERNPEKMAKWLSKLAQDQTSSKKE